MQRHINQNPFITTELGNPVSRQIQTLSLRNNRFSRLTLDSLRPFRGVQELDLSGNRLQTLSALAFSINKALRSLDLRNNPGAPFAQFVELESNGEGTAIRARLAGTIPFNTAVTLSATRAELDATEITIAAGEQFSEWVTVTPAGTGDVFILITETEFVTGDVYGFEAKVGDSTILFSVPDAPTVTAVAEDASAVLSWTESFSGTAPIAVWHYRVSADGGTNWTPDWTIVPSDAGPESLRIENLTNDTEHIFEISAVSVVGRGAAGRAVATPSAPKGVCDRSDAVKNAIVTALAVESCADVRHSRLADITDLNLNNSALTTLDSGDFAGLTALTDLDLSDNSLSLLPADVFDEPTALTDLDLSGNGLSSLPAGVFDNSTALTDLDLSENSLSSLPDAVFDKLTALTDLNLSDNSLSSLPAAVFDKLTALTDLDLSDNSLSSLPAGLFDGLTTLTMLDLSGNTVDPIPLDVTLQAVEDAEGKIQVHIAQGAPFAITVPLTPTNAELSASSVTIAAGSQNSPQVTLTPDEKGTVSAELGTLTLSLPTGFTSLKLNGGAELSVLFSPYAPEVTATPDHRAVGLTWTAGFDGGAAVTDWEIRHRPAEGEWGVWQKFGSATPSKHEIVNLENGTEYEFEVRALRGTLVVGAAGKATATPVPANTAPVFTDTDPVTRTLAENTAENTNLGDPIVATDAGDGNDETPTLTYILRGDDAAQFAIDSGTGQITVAEDAVLDFETKSSLKVIVDVHDGRDESGDEEVTPVVDASMPVNITLTDLLEPPARPSTASITATGASANSIQVSWTEPTNTGPPITDYDVRFRGALDDDYIDAGYDGVDREVLLLGLQPVSDYLIAVRARNEEGTGPWSRDSLGKTLAEPDNLTPSADAGPDQDVLVGSTVTLDGSASADLDEHPLTYSWTQLSGTTVTLDDSTAQMPSFTAPSTVGTLQFRLIVNDRRVDSSPDDVDIRVLAMPTTPNAPQEVSAQGHDRLIALKWKAGTDGGAAITAWQLRQASGTDDIEDSTWDTITSSSSPARTKRSHRVEVDNGVATEFQVRAMNSEGDGAASATVSATASLPTGGICDRTESVRDAIVDALPAEEVVDCGDVNDARLESLTGLSLSTKGLTALASGDLDGLSGLTSLDLSTNSLLDLPTGIFDELTELTTLNLSSNGLTLLDGELFKHTTKLESLNLSNNDLTFLDGKLFKYTTKLKSLNLGTNHLTVLPAGLFDGLTAFTSLKLNDNPVYPMRLNISFEFTNDEKTEGRVRVMQGAPFNITVELTAVNATLSTDSVTIERGSVVSPTVTITPTFNGEITIGQSSITRRPLSFRTELVYQGTVNESVAAPPGAPTLTAQSGNKFIDLSWSESNNGGSAITGWEYRWSDDNGENWDPSEGWHSLALATTELQLSGTNGTELTVELRAVNARGSGPATQVKATPTPDNSAPTFDDGENATRAVPENSTVDSNGDPVTVGTAITATDQDEGDVLTYALVDDEDSEDDEAFTINTESGQLSVAADANLNYESQDSYSLTVSVKDNRDDANNVDDAVDATIAVTVNIQDEIEPPATPAIPAVSNRSAHHLTISWSPPDNAGPEISSYNFDWRLPGASEFTTETPDGDAKNITLLGLTHSTTYEFRLQAVNAEGASGWSDTGTGTTLADVPEAPSALSAAINATDIDLSWTAGADRGAAIDLWQYRYSTDDGENWEDWTNIANSDATTAAHSVSNLSFGFVYTFEVRARNSTGFSASSPIASVVFGNRPAVFDDGAAVIRSVEENMAAGTKVGEPVVAQDPDGDTLTYSLSGTDAGSFDIDSNTGQITVGGSTVLDYETMTSYSMTVEVTDGKDETGASQTASTTDGTISVTVNVTDVKPPGAPTGLTLKSPSPTKLTVRWSAPDEGAPPTHYVVRYQEDGCTGLTCWSDGSTVKGTYTTLTGLTTATDYEVSVEAHNVEGSDADSAVARTRDLTKVTSVSLTSDAGDDSVYAIGDEVQATVMFDGRVFVSANANPTLVLAIGDKERTASYKSGGGTDSLLFSYVIVDGDSDSDGIGIAENALGIKETDLWDISGTAPASKHDAVTEQMDHQVDGIRPMITKLEITSKPTHNNTYARNESIIVKVDFDDTVYITGTPSLMLRVGDTIRAAPLLAGNRTSVLRFGYRVQIGDVDADGISVDKNSLAAFQGALRDETGNIALLTHAELGAQAGHKVNVPSNNAPEFAADAITTRTVSEDADVGTLIGAPFTATDADSNDPTTYTIAGTDAHRFDINSVGQISLGAAAMLDYERAPTLRVTVIATDTIGASAEIAVVIEVADVDSEAPLAPGAPTVTAAGADSLVVSWVPPANHGPAIIGYDIEYCLKSATECTEWTAHTSTGMSTNVTITGLLSDTAYDVHVRARNAEGIGDWSATGSGSTSSATNQAPTSVDFIATTSEDTAYVFSTADFVFIDTDQLDALSGVRLITIPGDATGQLELDEVVVTKNQLIAENKLSSLSFVPALNWNGETEFTFKVVDSKNTESASANTATIRVASVNDLPVFPVAATVWEVVENSAEGDAVGEPVTATDPDGDALRYALILPTSIPLTIDPRSGQVKLGANAVLDFEQQVTYFETITASDGEVTAQLLVTIKVLDQDNEAPGQPAAPTTKVVNAASLQVEWEPPATNTGPPLIDYDIRYRKQSATEWSEQQHAGIGTSTVITDLEKGADYDIQVRAKNVEGVSNWSDSGQGTPVNQAPTSEDFSVNTPTNVNFSIATTNFAFHDVDPGDALKAVRFTSLPSSGELVLHIADNNIPAISVNQEVPANSLSNLQYWVAGEFVGRVTFQFQVIDGSSASSASYTATISVGNVNQPPVSAPFLKLAVEDTEQSFMSEDFPFRDPDAADTLASVKFVSLPASEKGALMLGATAVTVDQVVAADDIDQLKFDPVANFAGEATFSFSVADPAGNVSKVHVATIQVAGVNDVPTTSAFSKFLDEDTSLSLAEIDFLFVDPDEGDKLTFVNFSSLPSSEEGALQLDGETVTANQQVKAADLGKLIFVPASHFFGDVTFGFSVIDTDGAASDVAVATMIVTSVNDPPTSASFNDSTLEDTPLLLNAAKFAFSDPDTDDSLKAVKFTVLPAVGNLRVGETEVTLNQLVPVASLASSSLASLHFVPPKDFFGNVTFDFRVVDSSDGESVDYRISVKVINVPDLPTAADILLTTDEDSSLAFKLADFKNAYSDGDGHALQSVTIVTLPESAEGVLQFNPAGDGVDDLVAIAANQVITAADLDTLIFEPVTNYHGTATFTYRVTDASEQSSDGSATVTITVRSVVDDPTAMDITKTVDEDTTLTFATSDFADDAFSSPETRTLKSIKIVTLPDATHGKLTVSTTDPPTDVGAGDTVVVANLDKLKFVPVADWNGKATFTFKVTDSSDRESLAAATATITVQAVNDPPKAADFSIAANKDTALVFTGSDFTSLFSDPDGHTMKSVKIASLPGTAQGVLKLNNTDVVVNQVIALTDLGTLRFTPAAEFVGTGSFTFRVIDSTDTESTKAYTVSIVVSSNFNLPTSSAIAKSVNEDTTLTFATADFTAKFADADNHTLKSVKIVTLPDAGHGTLKVGTQAVSAGDSVTSANLGTLKFEPVADFNGTASFTFKVTDSTDEETFAAATVTITVGAVNDPPTASNIEKSVNEDTILTFTQVDFEEAFSDADGHTLKSVKIESLLDSTHGTLTIGTQAVTLGQSIDLRDLGTLKFEPVTNWNSDIDNETATFTFKVTDSSDEEASTAATVTITVNAVNDLPTASDFSKTVDKNTALTFTETDFTGAFEDVDGHTLQAVKIMTLPDATHGTLTARKQAVTVGQSIQATDLGTLKFEPVADYKGTASFSFKVIDSSDGESATAATVSIKVTTVPRPSSFAESVDEDTTLEFTESDFTATNRFMDADGDTLKLVKIVTVPDATHGVLKAKVGSASTATDVQAGDTIVAANLGTLKFVPEENWNGDATFTYKVTDSTDTESISVATVTITVIAVNDLPTTSGFSASVNEDATLTITAQNFIDVFSDIDVGDTLKSVKILTLPTTSQGVLKAKVGSASTVANVQADDTVLAANLNTLTFEPVANFNGTANFTFKVIDSSDGESVAAATVTITVIAVDDPPITSNISKTVNEDTTVTFAASDFSDVFSDVDGHTLKSVKIVSLPDEMHGVLKAKVGSASTVTNVQTNDTILFANLGTLTFEPVANINGTASFTFKVIDSSDGESVSAATVTITLNAVNDLPTASNIEKSVDEDMTLTIAESDFTGVYSDVENDALKSVKIVTLPNTENWKLTVGTTDPPTDVQAGDTVVAANLDSLKFVPAANWNGTATFTFKVIDSEDGESVAAATMTITVDSVNDLPTASNFSKSVNEDTTVTFTAGNFTVAFSDVEDEAPKSVKIVTLPDSTHGVLKAKVGSATTVTDVQAGNTIVAANLNTLTFEPVADWNGTASFTFKVIDSSDGESVAAATVTITVNAVNDLPTASNLSKSVVENTTLTFAAGDFTGVFSDADGHTLKSVTIVSLPNTAHGTLKIGAQEASAGETVALASLGTLTFEPVANYTGSASFTFKVTDTSDSQSAAAATVTITVSETALPTASNISKSVNEDATLTLVAKDFNDAFSDGDGHTLKSVTIVTLPTTSQGVLKAKVGSASTVTNVQTNDTVLAANLGTLTFEPVANFNGMVTFTFKVTDSSDAESVAAATVTITVNAVNDLPTASNFTKSVNEDTTLTFIADNFIAAFNDVEDEAPKSVKIVAVPDATHGTLKAKVGSATTVTDVQAGNTIVAANLGTLTFEPVANWNGTASFTFKVIDSSDGESAAATVTITVNAVNDLPTASDVSKSVNEDTTLTFAESDFTGVYSDVDVGDTLKSVKIVAVPDATHGTLKAKVGSATTVTDVQAGNTIVAANLNTLTFEPVANWNGTATFTFKVIDSKDGESAAAATVTITVNAVDDLPTASNISKSAIENTTLTFAAGDFTGAFNDADGHTLKSVSIESLPDTTHGVLKAKVGSATTVTNVVAGNTVVAANLGTLTFEPAANYTGAASFTFKVTDSSDAESAAAATVTITVSATAAPTASNISKSVNEDATLTFVAKDFTDAFSDADNHTLKSVTIVTLPTTSQGVLKAKVGSSSTVTDVQANDTVLLANLGTLTFEPVANFNGTVTFTFKVTDTSDEESAAAATVTITVNAVDDLPTASNISKSAIENTTLTFAAGDFTGAFNDADGHTLKSVSIESLPDSTHGVLKAKVGSAATVTNVQDGNTIVAANLGTLTFEPAANYTGAAIFTFKVTDSSDAESAAAATVTITVSATAAPTASNISKSVNEDATLTFVAKDFTDAFSDADNHTLKSVTIVTLPTTSQGVLKAKVGSATTVTNVQAGNTILAANLGTLTFEPAANYTGAASFTFKVTDSTDIESAAAATVTITVNAVNDLPTATDVSKSVNEDATLTFAAGDFTGVFSDVDVGDTLKSVKVVTLPTTSQGVLKAKVGSASTVTNVQTNDTVLAANLNTLTFEPVANWNGTATFTFKVTDSSDGESTAAATATITVNAVADLPIASEFTKSTKENTTLTFVADDFTNAFSDADGDTLKSVTIVTLPDSTHGVLKAKVGSASTVTDVVAGNTVVAANLGTLTFEPVTNFNGTASFTFKVTDSSDAESSAAATVTITVSANVPPTATGISKSVNEDATLTFVAKDFTDAFSDTDGHTLKSVKIVTVPDATHGVLKAKVGSATTVTNVVAGNTVVAANLGTLAFEPVMNFNGSASFTFKVTDSSDAESSAAATVTITVNAVADLPIASNISKSVNEDTTLTFVAKDFTDAFSDVDGDTLKSVQIGTLPDATHGVLKAKVGSASTVTNVQTGNTIVAANLGTLKFEPVTNFNATATFTFKVTDTSDEESSAAATVTITVNAVNDVPTASNISKTVNEDTTLTFAEADFTGAFSDIDSGDTLKSVKIATLPNSAHGVLKAKVGSATTVTAVQAGNTVVKANLGTLTFEPVTNFNGTASFTFKVTDSSDGESSAAATVTITVNAVNDVPTASNFSKSVNEDTTLTFAEGDFTGAFSDIDSGDTLKSVKIVTLPSSTHGVLKAKVGSATTVTAVQAGNTVVKANLGTLTFEPVTNFNGTASFTFKVTDSSDGESSAAATVTITVNAVNDVPTASSITKSVNEDTTLTFAEGDFTGAFSDIDSGDTLKSVKIVTLPNSAHGVLKAKVGSASTVTAVQAGNTVVKANLGTLTFEPATNFNGTASFTFKVTDSSDGESSAAATVTITVNAVNDEPTASDIAKSVNEDTTLTFAEGDFTGAFSDIDSGDTLKSVKIVTLPNSAHGVLKAKVGSATTVTAVAAGNTVVKANLGTLKFEPVLNFNGTASFTFKVTDSSDGESSAAATVTITVNAVNDVPTASDITKSVNEDTTLTFAEGDFTGAFSDIDNGDTLKSVKIVTLPNSAHGVLKAKVGSATTVTAVAAGNTVLATNLGTLVFEPVMNFNGTASFTFKVIDSMDGESAAAATVTITVNAVNDVPTASDITKSVNEDSTLTFAEGDFTGAFSDIDSGDTLKSVKIATLPNSAHGVLKAKVGSATTVTAVQAGNTVVKANLGTLTFEPVLNFNGTASFTFKVTDSMDGESAAAATVTITVSAVNDVPTASNFSKSVNEDTTLTFAQSDFTGAFSDIDSGDTLKSVKIVTLPNSAHGVLKAKVGSGTTVTNVQAGNTVVKANLGTLTFEPVLNFNGTASFTFKVIDSMDGESAAAATVTITVNAVNDLPTASNFTKSVNEDGTLTFAEGDFTGAFSDIDSGDTLKSVKIVTLPDATHGVLKAKVGSATTVTAVQAGNTVVKANLGTLTFEPVTNFNGTASFTFKVTDSSDAESTAAATVTITVNAVNDVPTASDISKSVNEDTTLTFAEADFTGAFSDIDSGDSLKSVNIVTLPSTTHGVLKAKVGSADSPTTVQVNDEIASTNLGTLKFEPVANWNGTASFTFKVIDSMDGVSVAAASVTITVNAVNDVPVANAGDDRGVNPGDHVTLAGSATDIEGDSLTFSWAQTAGQSVTLAGANTATPSFTAPQFKGGLTFELTVSDGPNSDSDSVTITVGDTAPSFGSAVVSVPPLTANEEMEPIVLPEATGGNGTLTYSLSSEPSGLAGLSFDSTTRTLSGEPNSLGQHDFTWRAEDADDNKTNDAAILTFIVKVGEPVVARQTTLEQTLAGVTARVMSDAVANIGTRFAAPPVVAPRVSIAGRELPFGSTQLSDAVAAAETCSTATAGYNEWRRQQGGQQSGLHKDCQTSIQSVTWEEMLRDSSFEFSLTSPAGFGRIGENALGERQTPEVTLWGRGDLLTFQGRPEPETRYDGEALTGYLGIDVDYGDWLAGVAVSHGKSKTDYFFDGGDQSYEQGLLETELTMVHPYGRWDWTEDREVWAVLGAGWGTATHIAGHREDDPESAKLEVWMASAGVRQELKPVGDFKLAFRADLSFSHVETGESESGGIEQSDINGITADVARLRLGFEASRTWTLENGRTLTPFAEAMIRYDDGDGETGTGVELSGGLRYNSSRVEVEMLARTLVVHSADEYRESGASITARVKPRTGGIGLSMSIAPHWGAAAKNSDALWGDELSDSNTIDASDYSWALDGMIGYGIGISGTDGVLTPFSEIRLSEKDGRRVRVGTKFGFPSQNADRNYELEFAGERHDRKNGEVDRLISLNFRRQLGENYGDSFDIKLTGERKANDSDYSYGVQFNLRFTF